MIAFIRGNIAEITTDSLIIDRKGLGIEVFVPLSQCGQIAIGDEIFLHTHLHIREDAWLLFGFPQLEQLEIFRYLLSVSGIGPKIALVILNSLSTASIIASVNKKEAVVFQSVPGVGAKTAQRLVLELKDKFAKWQVSDDEIITMPLAISQETSDLLAALSQLGYNTAESRALAAKAVENMGQEAAVNDLIKEALRLAAKQ
jgi:Holliday junction DNA helicase RuvA